MALAAKSLLGGILGGCGGGCGDQKVSALESALGFEASKNYTDKTVIESRDRVNALQREAFSELVVQRERTTKLEAELKCSEEKSVLREEIAELKADKKMTPILLRLQRCEDSIPLVQERCMGAICAERQERKCADNAIVNYVNSTFYAKLVDGITSNGETTPQRTHNPLPCQCQPCGAAA